MIYYLLFVLYIISVVYGINCSIFHNSKLLTSLGRALYSGIRKRDLNLHTDTPHTKKFKVQIKNLNQVQTLVALTLCIHLPKN